MEPINPPPYILEIQNSIFENVKISGRNPSDVKIVAVSKTKPVEDIKRVYSYGFKRFGESKVQEAEQKADACKDLNIEWHLIGHLQTNKVKPAVQLFQLIHSVDSLRLIEKIDMEAGKIDKIQDILLQINISGEESKFGTDIGNWEELLAGLAQSKHIRCKGLMTIPPYSENIEDSRIYFKKLRELADVLKEKNQLPDDHIELSMGMSNDFPVAVQEGATYIRIGTAIFGKREYQT